ncbi:MAG TPA: zinc ribbon domain-containing protein [Candidatus Binataceae bacterium]|nr:zinc ribbon domain-containing protein [Candidatus Binataceae bacterium]
MPDFCTCGAQLPPDARFCHKCGKPQYDYPGLDVEVAEPEAIPPLPALPPAPPEIGFHNRMAVRIGFLAALSAVVLFLFPLPFPFLRLMIVLLAAGFLAVFLYSRRTGQMLSVRGGVQMGWITGIFSFILVSLIMTAALVAVSNRGGLANFLKSQFPANDARSDTLAQALNDPTALAGGMVFAMLMLFVVLTALPMIGGALGAKVLAKE